MREDRDQLCWSNLVEVAGLLERRELSPVELTKAVLNRIERLDPRLHAYLTVTADTALAQAKKAEAEIVAGRHRGPLHGVPIGIKDLCATKTARTTCASQVLGDFVPDHDATVVQLLENAGAVSVGKLNLTEFAMSGYAPAWPIPINPWSAEHYPGGSSSGSGVAVAAGLCFAAIGTDTGGSIRFPAAFCGVVGLKPTYGRVSRHGVFPLGDSLDHVGPMARSVADCAAMLDAIAGFDPLDRTSLRAAAPRCREQLAAGIKGLKIGLDRGLISENVQTEVSEMTLAAAAVLADLGAEIIEIRTAPIDQALLDGWACLCAADALVAHEPFYPARAAEYGNLFRTFLEYGASQSAQDYARAHARRLAFRTRFQDVFEAADVVICPSVPMLPPPIEFVDPYAPFSTAITPLMRFTAPFNFSGNPTLSLPSGFTRDGLPHSVQFVGPQCGEALLCRIGHAYEQATQWHERRPSIG